MTRSGKTITILFTAAALLALPGCKKRKPDLPPQSQAPSVPDTQQPSGNPPAQNPEASPATAQPQPAASEPAPPKPRPPHKPPRRAAPTVDKPEKPKDVARSLPPKIVIQEGAVPASSSAPVAPLLSHDDAAHNQATTEQLMASTESNLNGIKRQLSADEQALKNQILDYMNQSQQATKDGDLVRARNLALKAHLLSDDMVKLR